MDKNKALQLAQRYVDEVKSNGFVITEAKLFGSHATGKADEWSDIDVSLVSRAFTDQFESTVRLSHLKHAINDAIEPHPFTPEDIKSKWIPLASEIQKQGIALKV